MRSALDSLNLPLEASVAANEDPTDLSEATHMGVQPQADLVLCIEVGEHVPLKFHKQLVRALASRVRDGGYLLFSAAPPGACAQVYP